MDGAKQFLKIFKTVGQLIKEQIYSYQCLQCLNETKQLKFLSNGKAFLSLKIILKSQYLIKNTMIGGLSSTPVTQEHQDLVKANLASINSSSHANATSYHVDKAWVQVVAGTNYFFHVTDNNHKKWSVFVEVPLPHTNAPAKVTHVAAGHNAAKNPH